MLNIILATMPIWLENILVPILLALGTGIAGLITYGFTRLNAWINLKVGNEKLANALERVADIVHDAIVLVNQRMVDDLKATGKFNPEKQKEAFELALSQALALIDKETKKLLEEVYGDLAAYLSVLIEATIKRIKDGDNK